MRNSINSISEVFGGMPASVDIDDNSSDLVVMQRADMDIHHTARIATRYRVERPYWVVKLLGYNASDEVVYIQTEKPTVTPPDFIPDEVL